MMQSLPPIPLTVEHTVDHLLNGQVTITQPTDGFRAGVDAVLLSACVPPLNKGDRVMDVGCGVGSAGLCYGVRAGLGNACDNQLILIECNAVFAPFLDHNIRANALEGVCQYHMCDISTKTPIKNDSINHILTNPPYETAIQGTPSPHHTKHLGNIETTAPLPCWVKYCHRVLKRGGTLSMIHRADRLHHILHALCDKFGDIHILPIKSLAHKPAIRVLIHARKDTGGGCTIHAPLILQQRTIDRVRYTEQGDAILRHGQAIDWKNMP